MAKRAQRGGWRFGSGRGGRVPCSQRAEPSARCSGLRSVFICRIIAGLRPSARTGADAMRRCLVAPRVMMMAPHGLILVFCC